MAVKNFQGSETRYVLCNSLTYLSPLLQRLFPHTTTFSQPTIHIDYFTHTMPIHIPQYSTYIHSEMEDNKLLVVSQDDILVEETPQDSLATFSRSLLRKLGISLTRPEAEAVTPNNNYNTCTRTHMHIICTHTLHSQTKHTIYTNARPL